MQVHQAMMPNMIVLADVPKKKPAEGEEKPLNFFMQTIRVVSGAAMLVLGAKAISNTYDATVDNLHYKYDQYFNP